MKRGTSTNTFAIAAAWITVIAIAYATLTQVGFVYGIYFKLSPYLLHPAMRTYGHFEHIVAFFFLGALCVWRGVDPGASADRHAGSSRHTH
jgi:hypothetical protein